MPLMHDKDSFSNFVGEGVVTNFDDKIVHEHVTDNGKKCKVKMLE